MLAYSNGSGPERSLVLYHTRFATTTGRIHRSARYAVKAPDGSKRKIRRTLADGLGLPDDPAMFVTFRDSRTGLEYVRSCREIREKGLELSLDAYRSHVFWEFREVRDGVSGQWARLAARLGGDGVPSLDDALRGDQLEPIHVPLRSAFADGLAVAVMDGVATEAQLDELERRFETFLAAIAQATGVDGDPAAIARRMRASAERAFATPASSTGTANEPATADLERVAIEPGLDRRDRATVLAWLILSRTGALAPDSDEAATSLAWYEELRLPDRPRRRPARRRVRRGRGVVDRGSRPCPARPAPPVDHRRFAADGGRAAPEGLAADRGRPGRHRREHLGRRRVHRSRPIRGVPRLGRPPRPDRIG